MASDLPFYNISAPQKVPILKIYDDVIARDLLFGATPNQKSCQKPRLVNFHLVVSFSIFTQFRWNRRLWVR